MTPAHGDADALLAILPRTTLVVGKGGVGKTTCAAAIAIEFASRGQETLLVSTDPAAALSSVLAVSVGADAAPVTLVRHLSARQFQASELRKRFLDRWREVITQIVDRGTYLDSDDVAGLVDTALPGADEVFALLELGELLAGGDYDRIVVDTAPTGHTLRLLQLPETFAALVALLDAMQEKHRFMVRALTHRYRADNADAFLAEMRGRVETLRAAFTGDQQPSGGSAEAMSSPGSAAREGPSPPDRVAAVLVTRTDPVVQAESERYLSELRHLSISVAAIVANATDGPRPPRAHEGEVPAFSIPRIHPPPRGVDDLRGLLHTTRARRTRSGVLQSREPAGTRPADLKALLRPLTIVGGKGGVGKTTVACALAVASATREAPVLLVSTDPAPSIADALGVSDAAWTAFNEETAIAAAPGLTVRQMDAAAAFARLRDRYTQQVDAIFETVLARGVDVAADRRIVRDLLALAPPGVDEVFALSILGDALAERRFARVIVDPAPTGHLLRLLEMPAIVLDWSHRLLRLMLKYKELSGLGETTAEILAFARRTRALRELLADPARSGMLLVSLDEPVVRQETVGLAAAAESRGVSVLGLLWNRCTAADDSAHNALPLPSSVAARQFCAPAVEPPPTGVTALRAWSRGWRSI